MDVIAYASAVGSGVVVAKDQDFVPHADGDLHDIWHEIVWRADGVFADQPTGVGTDGVEVSQVDGLKR